jgi:hypothetical protein
VKGIGLFAQTTWLGYSEKLKCTEIIMAFEEGEAVRVFWQRLRAGVKQTPPYPGVCSGRSQ